MDGFVLILAIIVFSVFKNVMQEAKKKQGKGSLPDVFDTLAEHDDSVETLLFDGPHESFRVGVQITAGDDPILAGREESRIDDLKVGLVNITPILVHRAE